MEQNLEESKAGLYDVYYTDTGKKLIVLDDLYLQSQYEPPVFQQKIHAHYDSISLFYWALFATAVIYLSLTSVCIPFLQSHNILKK